MIPRGCASKFLESVTCSDLKIYGNVPVLPSSKQAVWPGQRWANVSCELHAFAATMMAKENLGLFLDRVVLVTKFGQQVRLTSRKISQKDCHSSR